MFPLRLRIIFISIFLPFVGFFVDPQNKNPSSLKIEITNSIGMKFRLIPPGSFVMGGELDNEKPRHRIEITRPFYMGIYEVTQEQYEKVMGENPSGLKGSKLPVESVSWNAAVEFCRRLSQKTGEQYRLPTEAEWEYAARGGLESKKYVWGDQDVPEVKGRKQANVADKSYRQTYDWLPFKGYDDGFVETSPVGRFAPNGFGLYDMAGNVWERCSDWYEDSYFSTSPVKDPKGPASGERKVLRGGGWGSGPENARIAFRCGTPLDRGGDNDGFRVVKEVKAELLISNSFVAFDNNQPGQRKCPPGHLWRGIGMVAAFLTMENKKIEK